MGLLLSEKPPQKFGKNGVLYDLLRHVSRSFYLTLRVLPASLRSQVGVAYLFCRAADTIADTDLFSPPDRLKALEAYRWLFDTDPIPPGAMNRFLAMLKPCDCHPAERRLLETLPAFFGLLSGYDYADRRLIVGLVGELTRGMEMDLRFFPLTPTEEPRALQTMSDLDRYTYFVAGVVGDFWTRISVRHLPSLSRWEVDSMAAMGVRFGKGLQMTNILKDLARDLSRGRCYLPVELFNKHHLQPSFPFDPAARDRLQPLICELAALAGGYLEAGWGYLLAIPRREVRLRLACLWPLLFALATLERLLLSPELLDPGRSVKINRGTVYGIMGRTALEVGSNRALTRHFRSWKGRLDQALASGRSDF